MATILPTSTSPAPAYLTSDYRYAGDDWTESNALIYVVWSIAPIVTDGVVTTPGTPRDLTGCTVSGVLRYGTAVPQVSNCVPTSPSRAPVPVAGSIVGEPTNGEIALSLPCGETRFAPQPYAAFGDPSQAAFFAQPMVTGPDGALVTVGLQPLFVF